MTQFNHFSLNAFTHLALMALFAWTLWRIPRKTSPTKFLIAYCLFSVGGFLSMFLYSSLNVPSQNNIGITNFAWLLAVQWMLIEFAYTFAKSSRNPQFAPTLNLGFARISEHKFVRGFCATATIAGTMVVLLHIPRIIGFALFGRLMFFVFFTLLLMNIWAGIVFLRQGLALRSAISLEESPFLRRKLRGTYLFSALTLLTLVAYSLEGLRSRLVVSYLSSAIVGNILTTLYIAGFFVVFTSIGSEERTEEISTTNKLKFIVVAALFLFISPVCVIIIADRQREYEDMELQKVQEIDRLFRHSNTIPQSEQYDALKKLCEAASVRAVVRQAALVELPHIEQYFIPNHPPNGEFFILYLAPNLDSAQFDGKLKIQMMEKSVDAGRTINGAEYFAGFFPALPNDSIRFDTHLYTWKHDAMLYQAALPYRPLAKYVERPALMMFGMVVLAVLLVPLAIDALLRQTFDKPLQSLLAGMNEANRGDLNKRVTVEFHDEIGGITAHFNEMMDSIQTTQARYYQALEQTQRERERISQDVHDDVGSMLTQIALLAESLKYQISSLETTPANSLQKSQMQEVRMQETQIQETQINQRLAAIADVSRNATASLSEIIWAINPANDSPENFCAFVREYVADLFEEKISADLTIAYSIDTPKQMPPMELPPEVRRNAFLIIKESLNNVVKYAKATSVRVSIDFDNKMMVISIADNGCGFDAERVLQPVRHGGGNGLKNMRRRAERMGGRFEIDSKESVGTRITAQIPIEG